MDLKYIEQSYSLLRRLACSVARRCSIANVFSVYREVWGSSVYSVWAGVGGDGRLYECGSGPFVRISLVYFFFTILYSPCHPPLPPSRSYTVT